MKKHIIGIGFFAVLFFYSCDNILPPGPRTINGVILDEIEVVNNLFITMRNPLDPAQIIYPHGIFELKFQITQNYNDELSLEPITTGVTFDYFNSTESVKRIINCFLIYDDSVSLNNAFVEIVVTPSWLTRVGNAQIKRFYLRDFYETSIQYWDIPITGISLIDTNPNILQKTGELSARLKISCQ